MLLPLAFARCGSPVVVRREAGLVVDAWLALCGCVFVLVATCVCVPVLICGRRLSEVRDGVCVLVCCCS